MNAVKLRRPQIPNGRRARERIRGDQQKHHHVARAHGGALGDPTERLGPFSGRGFAQMAYDKGLFVLAAAQSQEAAREFKSREHGLLTDVLVNAGLVDGKADNDPADKTITIREFMTYPLKRVPEEFAKLTADLRSQAGGADPSDEEKEKISVMLDDVM